MIEQSYFEFFYFYEIKDSFFKSEIINRVHVEKRNWITPQNNLVSIHYIPTRYSANIFNCDLYQAILIKLSFNKLEQCI